MIDMIFEYFVTNGDSDFLIRRLKNVIVSKTNSTYTYSDKVNNKG